MGGACTRQGCTDVAAGTQQGAAAGCRCWLLPGCAPASLVLTLSITLSTGMLNEMTLV